MIWKILLIVTILGLMAFVIGPKVKGLVVDIFHRMRT